MWAWRKVWIKKYPGKCGQGLGFESATLWKTEMAYYYKWRIRADIEDITRWKKQYFTNERSEWVKYWFCHSEIKFISSSRRVMFFLLYIDKKTSIKLFREITEITWSINSRVRLWKIDHSGPGCSFHEFYEWYISHWNTRVYIIKRFIALACMD